MDCEPVIHKRKRFNRVDHGEIETEKELGPLLAPSHSTSCTQLTSNSTSPSSVYANFLPRHSHRVPAIKTRPCVASISLNLVGSASSHLISSKTSAFPPNTFVSFIIANGH